MYVLVDEATPSVTLEVLRNAELVMAGLVSANNQSSIAIRLHSLTCSRYRQSPHKREHSKQRLLHAEEGDEIHAK